MFVWAFLCACLHACVCECVCFCVVCVCVWECVVITFNLTCNSPFCLMYEELLCIINYILPIMVIVTPMQSVHWLGVLWDNTVNQYNRNFKIWTKYKSIFFKLDQIRILRLFVLRQLMNKPGLSCAKLSLAFS